MHYFRIKKSNHYNIIATVKKEGSQFQPIIAHLPHNMVQSSHMSTNFFPRQCIFTINWTKSLHTAMQNIRIVATNKPTILPTNITKKASCKPGCLCSGSSRHRSENKQVDNVKASRSLKTYK
jgi:hypothetical protein